MKTLLRGFGTALLWSLAWTAVAAPGSDLKARFNAAKKLIRSGQPQEGVPALRALLAERPGGTFGDEVRIYLCEARGKLGEKGAALAPERPGRIYSEGEVDERPEPIHQPASKTIRSMRGQEQGGKVMVNVLVDTDGCVAATEIEDGLNPQLDRASQDAIEHWVFSPGQLDGKRVAAQVSVRMSFDMKLEIRLSEPRAEPPP